MLSLQLIWHILPLHLLSYSDMTTELLTFNHLIFHLSCHSGYIELELNANDSKLFLDEQSIEPIHVCQVGL